MRKYLVILLSSFCFGLLFEELTFAENNYNNYYPRRYYNRNYNVLPQNNLKALEKYAFQKHYTKDAELSRIERLEELAFGSIQSGDINTRYKNVENAILSRPQYNHKQNWRHNINNYFTGQPTGITPNMSPFFSNNYVPSFNNSRVEQFNNSFWNNGYRINSNGYTSGSGVKILD